jgi:hypothetical protein
MARLNGRFDGKVVVLEQPLPAGLKPNTSVDVLVADERENALKDLTDFLTMLWQRPVPPGTQVSPQRWPREELHDRR